MMPGSKKLYRMPTNAELALSKKATTSSIETLKKTLELLLLSHFPGSMAVDENGVDTEGNAGSTQ